METRGYTNKQAAEALDLKPATVSYYTNRGFVEPEVSNPKGKGTTRRYSRRNLVELLVIRRLVDGGVKLEAVERLLRFLGRPDVRNGTCSSGMTFDPLDPDDERRPEGARVFLVCMDDDTPTPAFDIRWIEKPRPEFTVSVWNPRHERPIETWKAFDVTPILETVQAL